eukprot:4984003-Prymnesium_polylepis.1
MSTAPCLSSLRSVLRPSGLGALSTWRRERERAASSMDTVPCRCVRACVYVCAWVPGCLGV